MAYEFSVRYRKVDESNLIFSINYQKLNIVILSITRLPGPVPDGDPDSEMSVRAYDGVDVFFWAWFAAKQKNSITLS